MTSDITVHCIVHGRVQGVGFRYFVYEEATRLSLRGHVRNLPGGEVEVLAAGPANKVNHLLDSLRTGPPGAQVREIRELPVEAGTTPPTTFEILM